MHVSWLGLSCLRIQNKNANILVNPFNEKEIGVQYSKAQYDIVVDHNNIHKIKKDTYYINSPGEYEIKGVFVYSRNVLLDKQEKRNENDVILRLVVDDISIGHLGLINGELSKTDLDWLEGVDVLILPIGGQDYTLDYKKALKLLNIISPKIVIPVCYSVPDLKIKLDEPTNFLKELGQADLEAVDKFKLVKKSFPEDGTSVVLLSKS